MRISVAVVLAWISAAPASAQAIDSGFVFGRDYTFERMEATRAVDDAQDKGTIRLVTLRLPPGEERPARSRGLQPRLDGRALSLAQGAGRRQCHPAGGCAVPGDARLHPWSRP
jgi:hypothetical protein